MRIRKHMKQGEKKHKNRRTSGYKRESMGRGRAKKKKRKQQEREEEGEGKGEEAQEK